VKVGVFDSGVGGITVLSELFERFPGVDFVYLGDTAHVPYGTKSPAQIRKLSVDCALTLKTKGVEYLVVACNSASSWALPEIADAIRGTPVFGVVKPGVESALKAAASFPNGAPILVLATRATVQSKAYATGLGAQSSHPVLEQACPLLVPMIEESWIDHPILHQTLATYLAPHREKYPSGGVALLGCTHYPWIQSAVEKALPGWTVVNSAKAVADSLDPTLKTGTLESKKSQIEWIFTDPDAVPGFARAPMQALTR
jgi:glutamate racemase